MSDLNAYWLLQRATTHLDNANSELNRPSQDIVAFSVCQQSKGIIADFMRSFLLLHGKHVINVSDLESLRQQCGQIDPRFTKLDLGCMSCHPARAEGDSKYCLDIERVKSCANIADQVKDLVDDSFRKKENR
ncbi:MAG: hypothetical protein IT233_04385 [Bacteroidia bacterium]|nr:hypothetical protein [Bacteroidia bacterium]